MAAMTLTAFVQVVARYVFNYSFVWALELNGVFFAWLIFIGMSYGVRVGAHIGIDAVVKQLRPARRAPSAWWRRRSASCTRSSSLVGGWQYVRKMYDVGIEMQDLPIAQWVPRIILPLGFALLACASRRPSCGSGAARRRTLLADEAEEALKLRDGDGVALGEVRE